MTSAIIDIVVPIWNRPNETRNCLVNLLTYTPGARVVMVDTGSERDTERILQELADADEDRTLLLRDDHNLGFVRGANKGLMRGEAPFLALVRSGTLVPPGWLTPLLDFAERHPEAGILVPRLSTQSPELPEEAIELERGAFDAMVIRRSVFEVSGGLDEGMDDGTWCLKDYTRRACAKGYLTFAVPTPELSCEEEVRLGSTKRREEALNRSLALFAERWGVGHSYCVHVPEGVDAELFRQKMEVLLEGARHGDRFLVFLPRGLYHGPKGGSLFGHEHIRVVPLPRFAGAGKKERLFRSLLAEYPAASLVTAVDGIPFPWDGSYLQFTELAERVRRFGAG